MEAVGRREDRIIGIRVVFLMVWTICYSEVKSARILFVPFIPYSHCSPYAVVGNALIRRGHSITAYVPDHEISDECLNDMGGERLKFTVHNRSLFEYSSFMYETMPYSMVALHKAHDFGRALCAEVLGDHVMLNEIKKRKFDLAVLSNSFMRCLYLIPYKFKIPFVVLNTAYLEWFDGGLPFLPNVEPYPLLGYPAQMTFVERVVNFGTTLLIPFAFSVPAYNNAEKEFAPELSLCDFISLMRSAKLFIVDSDLLLHGPVPTSTNNVYVGPLSVKSPGRLQSGIKEFYQGARHGVIVVAFGSYFSEYSASFEGTLALAFSEIEQRVLWRNVAPPRSSNVMTRKWIAQNDALGHNKTVLFISHCGRKSFYESIYHRVPLICIPLMWDQESHAKRVESMGIGIKLDYTSLVSSHLKSEISRVLLNATFRESVHRWSNIGKDIHSQPASEAAADAMEHIIRHGGKHFRPATLDLSIVSFLMLDIWGLLGLSLLAFIVSVFTFCRCLFSLCHKSKVKTE